MFTPFAAQEAWSWYTSFAEVYIREIMPHSVTFVYSSTRSPLAVVFQLLKT